MTVASNFVNRAMQMIGVKRVGIDLTDQEMNDGTETLRDMLVELQTSNIKLPFNIPLSPDDDIEELDFTKAYFELMLAMRFCLFFTVEPTQNLASQYRKSKDAVMRYITEIGPMQKSPNVPIGTGNEEFGTQWRRYYVNLDRDSLATGSGSTIIDDEGENILIRDSYQSGIVKGN